MAKLRLLHRRKFKRPPPHCHQQPTTSPPSPLPTPVTTTTPILIDPIDSDRRQDSTITIANITDNESIWAAPAPCSDQTIWATPAPNYSLTPPTIFGHNCDQPTDSCGEIIFRSTTPRLSTSGISVSSPGTPLLPWTRIRQRAPANPAAKWSPPKPTSTRAMTDLNTNTKGVTSVTPGYQHQQHTYSILTNINTPITFSESISPIPTHRTPDTPLSFGCTQCIPTKNHTRCMQVHDTPLSFSF